MQMIWVFLCIGCSRTARQANVFFLWTWHSVILTRFGFRRSALGEAEINLKWCHIHASVAKIGIPGLEDRGHAVHASFFDGFPLKSSPSYKCLAMAEVRNTKKPKTKSQRCNKHLFCCLWHLVCHVMHFASNGKPFESVGENKKYEYS